MVLRIIRARLRPAQADDWMHAIVLSSGAATTGHISGYQSGNQEPPSEIATTFEACPMNECFCTFGAPYDRTEQPAQIHLGVKGENPDCWAIGR